jgi:hypothetical protein
LLAVRKASNLSAHFRVKRGRPKGRIGPISQGYSELAGCAVDFDVSEPVSRFAE